MELEFAWWVTCACEELRVPWLPCSILRSIDTVCRCILKQLV